MSAGQTRTLMEVLRRHYIKPGPLPGGVFVPECGVNGGRQSRADALYVGFTSTSGRILIGHEVKTSRSDWRKELDSAGKADFWADNCHAWYIVAPGPEVAPAEEIPDGWGLMYPNPRTTTRMQIVVKARVHHDRTPSWNATRSILARLDTLRAQHDAEVESKAVDKARKVAREASERQANQGLTSEQHRKIESLDRIEKVLGVQIMPGFAFDDAVNAETAAAAIAMLKSGQDATRRHVAGSYIKHARAAVEAAEAMERARIELAERLGAA